MIDNPFREVLPRFAGPVLRLYARLGLSPNGISVLAFLLSAVSAASILDGRPLLAIVFWWLGRLADGTDGLYARTTGRASDFGAYFDIVLDMAAYSLIVVALDRVHPELHGRWIAMLFFYVLCIASALALGMQEGARGLPRRDDRGLRLGAGLAEGGETGIAAARTLLAWRLLRAPSQ